MVFKLISRLPILLIQNQCHQCIRRLRGSPSETWKQQSCLVSPARKEAIEKKPSLSSRPTPLSSNYDPEFVKSMYPEPQVTFNLAPFVDQSETLKKLIKLGVKLYKLEANRSVAERLIQIDFDQTIKPVIQFLSDSGLHPDKLGHFLTENPFILEEPLANLQARIDYLKSKAFSRSAIVRIITDYPLFLSQSFKKVDARLGFLVQEYELTANQVRSVLVNFPAVVGLHVMTIRAVTFTLKEELGLERQDVRHVVVSVPSILSSSRQVIANVFDILHNDAEIPHEVILKFPEVFSAEDERTLESRLHYLQILKRDQFDPEKPLFIPLTVLTEGDDEVFAVKYARTSIEDYNLFLKSR